MINLTINKDQISRLKALNDYVRKMDNFSPIAGKQVFNLVKDKLTIYGIADTTGAGHIESTFDVTSNDSVTFGLELIKFIVYLEKAKSDEINVSIDNNTMTVKSKTNKVIIKQAVVDGPTNLDEIKDYIKDKLAKPEFNKPIEVKLDHKDLIINFGNLTKLQDTNHQVQVGKGYVKTADNLCISTFQSVAQVSTVDDILIDRDIMALFKNIDQFKISSDKKTFYFDIQNYGIKLMFTPKIYNWSFPTDDELNEIKPDAGNQKTIKINSQTFYDKIEEFDGVFEQGSWRYSQINIRTPKNFATKKELELQFDDTVGTEIRNFLPVEISTDTNNKDDFVFMIPTMHFSALKDILLSEETFNLKYSDLQTNQPHGIAIEIENNKISIVIAKMVV